MQTDGMLEIKNLSCGYDSAVIEGFSLVLKAGEMLCILGRNGIGKTTLFRTLLGTLKPLAGEVLLGGRDLLAMNRQEKAAYIAYVPQTHNPPFAYTAFDIVLMGRAGLISAFSQPSAQDRSLAEDAMKALGVSHLAARAYTKISGGERQLILIARAICQGADYLFLDEPAANLDYGNQMKVLSVLRTLTATGKGVIFTSHDPGHALLLGARVAAIHAKDSVAVGTAETEITAETAQSLYGIRAEILETIDEESGKNVKIFAAFLD